MELELRREDFINQYPPINFATVAEVKDIWEKERFHLYVHIPYCVKKCSFCYYKSIPLGTDLVPRTYLNALIKEILMYSRMPQIQSKKIKSIYFGGGTPTILSIPQLEELLSAIHDNFEFDDNFEFCCEARPGAETSKEKLEVLMKYGLKRLSLGCQSLDEDVLQVNGRNHNVDEFYKTYKMAKELGIESINVDLMSGLINQSYESWIETLEKIIELKPENIAVYKLELYLNNELHNKFKKGELNMISDSEEAEYVKNGFKLLIDSGYHMTDNFSFTSDLKYDHIHRRNVWHGDDMLGVGASAHSCFNDFIFQNEIRIPEYINKIESNELAIIRAHTIAKREDMVQRLIFGLKNMGYEKSKFKEEFGVDVMDVFGDTLKELENMGLVFITEEEVGLTYEGGIYADDIVREFYMPEHKNMKLAHVMREK